MPEGVFDTRLPRTMRPRRPQTTPSPTGDLPEFLAPRSLTAVRELAKMIVLAEWAPDSYRDAEGQYSVAKVELAIMQGAAVGLGPIAAVQSIAVIDGTPTIKSDGALALVQRSGLLEDLHEEYVTDADGGLTAISTMRRHHQPTPISSRFSLAMAEQAGLTQQEGPWRSYRERMLMIRARSWTLRDGFADVLRGLYIREEVEDYATVPARMAFPSSRTSRLDRPRFAAPSMTTRRAAGRADRPVPIGAPRAPVGNRQAMGRIGPLATVTCDAYRGADSGVDRAPPNDGEEAPAQSITAREETFTLVDAEGEFIEVAGAQALREALEALLDDRFLSPDQVIGLWESNAAARAIIVREFGSDALAAVEARVAAAGPARQPSVTQAAAADAETPPPRRARSGRRPRREGQRIPVPEPHLVLQIDPEWTDRELLRAYRGQLETLRQGRRAKAATIARFRQANREAEARLRVALPELIGPIDAFYAWAAKYAQ